MPLTLRGAADENLLEFGEYSSDLRDVTAESVSPRFAASPSTARLALSQAPTP